VRKFLHPQALSRFFLKLFLLTFPFQIQTLLYKADFISGQFNYFVTFFITISEVLLILSVLCWAVGQIFYPQKKGGTELVKPLEVTFLGALLGIVMWNLLSVFWAVDKELALLAALRWFEFSVLIFVLGRGVLPKDVVLKYLFWGAFVQVIIGLGQYLKQGSVGLYVLGEPRLGADYFNIAKIDLGGEKILRSYGTFSHANIFGGYLFVCLSLLIQSLNKKDYINRSHFIVVFLMGLLISFSRSAWVAFFVFLIMLIVLKATKVNWKQLILTLALIMFILVVFSLDRVILARIIDFSLNAWDERLIFSGVAREIIFENPLLGIGSGNFVLSMPTFVGVTLSPWVFQPAHNFFLMVLSEIGVFGLMFWIVLFFTSVKMMFASVHRLATSQKFPGKAYLGLFVGLLVVLMMDHYFYTMWAGQVMLAIVFGMVYLDYRKRQMELIAK
jgi:O-antigen ligase